MGIIKLYRTNGKKCLSLLSFVIIAFVLKHGILLANPSQNEKVGASSKQSEGSYTFKSGRLEVRASGKTIFISVDDTPVYEFPVQVAVDTDESRNNDLFKPSFRKDGDQCIWTIQSSNWEKKEFILSVQGNAVVLQVKVQGNGKLTKLRYFRENEKCGQNMYHSLDT